MCARVVQFCTTAHLKALGTSPINIGFDLIVGVMSVAEDQIHGAIGIDVMTMNPLEHSRGTHIEVAACVFKDAIPKVSEALLGPRFSGSTPGGSGGHGQNLSVLA
jgi:hypothetical protein